jgi:hypothetical protein
MLRNEFLETFPAAPLQSLFRRLPSLKWLLSRQKREFAQIAFFATAQDCSRKGET